MTQVTAPEIRRTGEALAHAARELVRVWRAARQETRPTAFPGLADGVVESLVAAVGEALVVGRAPEEVWSRVEGVVRLDHSEDGQADEELFAEGRLLTEVLASACEALDTGPAVADEVARAAERAAQGLLDLRDGPRPHGVVVVWQLSPLRPRVDPRR